jgi:hypothetical protein
MHGSRTVTTSDVLRELIRACVDDVRTLRHESSFVGVAQAEALVRLACEREQFVTDLERLAKREHPHDGSWSELAREAERDVWAVAAGRNSGDAIASCRHSRARTEAVYDEALQASWPDEIQHLLAEQRHRLRDEADELVKLQF